MLADINHEKKRIEAKNEIGHYVQILKFAVNSKHTKVTLQKEKFADKERDERYTNHFTLDDLFPDEDYVDVLKRELLRIEVEDYIETVEDTRFPQRPEMRVFGRKYGDDVYIKIRAELLKSGSGKDEIYVMSFHYAEWAFTEQDFPYKNK